MDAQVLKTLAQVAGIGGLALGVFLLLFRDIIGKNVFPQLGKQHAYNLLRLISLLVWSVALVGIGAWVWTEARSADQPQGSVRAGRDINARDIVIGTEPKARDSP